MSFRVKATAKSRLRARTHVYPTFLGKPVICHRRYCAHNARYAKGQTVDCSRHDCFSATLKISCLEQWVVIGGSKSIVYGLDHSGFSAFNLRANNIITL